jgi:hypothetical protein
MSVAMWIAGSLRSWARKVDTTPDPDLSVSYAYDRYLPYLDADTGWTVPKDLHILLERVKKDE